MQKRGQVSCLSHYLKVLLFFFLDAIWLTSQGLSLTCTATAQQRPVTIEDCIRLSRVQQTYDPNDPSVVFSNDGRQFVTMVWRGNFSTNLNDYTLLLYDAEHLDQPPKELLKVSFAYEEIDQHARPLKQFAFLTGNRLAALATLHGEPRQVVSIDLSTKAVTQLTNHPGDILAFAAAPDGKSLIFAARAPADDGKKARLYRDGFSLEDYDAIDSSTTISEVAVGAWFKPPTEYFLVTSIGTPPCKIYKIDEKTQRTAAHFWVSPDGRQAVVNPYKADAGGVTTFGLIDMASGKLGTLVPGDAPGFGRVIWAGDSRSLLVCVSAHGKPGVLYDISLPTRQVTSVRLSQGREWELLGWAASGKEIILTRSGFTAEGDPERTLATLHRTANGWNGPNAVTRAESNFDLNPRYYGGTNGRLIVGVKDGLSEAPELAAYDRESKVTRILTHYNSLVRNLKLGEVTRLQWSGPFEKGTSFGYLIKPVGYVPGRRYPLIIQLKDETYYPYDNSFILDGQEQYSAAAIQVWANAGFMILFTPYPRSVTTAILETPDEEKQFLAHIESGLDLLDSQGLIDRNKLAITGWSRSAWMAEYILTHSKTKFGAASAIDNVEYNLNQYILRFPNAELPGVGRKMWGGLAPWGDTSERWREHAIDFKYDLMQTPMLMETHGMRYGNVIWRAETYAALKTAHTPVDFYVYPDAAHSLKSPLHRLHSLSTNTDWFRFWLQDYEDPTPEKQAQYARWRKMRVDWEAAKAAAAKPSRKE